MLLQATTLATRIWDHILDVDEGDDRFIDDWDTMLMQTCGIKVTRQWPSFGDFQFLPMRGWAANITGAVTIIFDFDTEAVLLVPGDEPAASFEKTLTVLFEVLPRCTHAPHCIVNHTFMWPHRNVEEPCCICRLAPCLPLGRRGEHRGSVGHLLASRETGHVELVGRTWGRAEARPTVS